MTYEALLKQGREMSEEVRQNNIRALALDPRFGAVLALLEEESREYARGGSAQQNAAFHGALAHAFGSIFGLDTFAAKLQQIMATPMTEAKP